MEAVNEFIKGAISDPDYLKRGDGVWAFPTVNIRVINKEGQGYIITPMDGITESFSLNEGFIPVGGFEFNGIAFIASYNALRNQGQLGTYPSPNYDAQNNGSDPEWLDEYHPLINYDDAEFTTSRFNWSPERFIRFTYRKSFDNSIDMYLADNYNPNLAINCGFDVDSGQLLTFRIYTDDDFNGPLHHIPSSINVPIMDFGFTLNGIPHEGIEYGGRLEPGNYTIFIRLLTKDYARTAFLEWIGPITIAEGNTPNSTTGLQEMIWKSGIKRTANKKINLKIKTSTIQGYEYFELGILRRSADTENGDSIEYSYLISNYYPIGDDVTHYVTITGTEKRETLLYEELVSPRMPYSICKDHAHINDTYMGINWKKRFQDTNYQALKDFALYIRSVDRYITDSDTNGYVDFIGEKNSAWHLENGLVNSLDGLRDPRHMLKHIGTFRSSTTPVGIVYVFKDNTETDVFPITGFRFANEADLFPILNSKGLCSTRSWAHFVKPERGICLQLDFTFAAEMYLNDTSLFDDIMGFRIVMADRLDNFIGQGILLPGYDSWEASDNDPVNVKQIGFGQANRYDKDEAYTIPLIDGSYPYMIHHVKEGEEARYRYNYLLEQYKAPGTNIGYKGIINAIDPIPALAVGGETGEFKPRYAKRTGYEKIPGDKTSFVATKYGLVIPDMNFEMNVQIPEETFIQPAMKVVPFYGGNDNKGPFYSFDEWPIIPRYVGFDVDHNMVNPDNNANLVQSSPTKETKQIKSYFIDKFTSRGPQKFSSYQPAGFTLEGDSFDRYDESGGSPMIHRRYNRSFAMSRYVGIVDDSGENKIEDYVYWTVSLFKIDPIQLAIDAEGNFVVFNTIYRPVTEVIRFATIAPNPLAEVQINLLKGDCFHQKSFTRLGRWYGFEKPAINEDMTNTESQGGEWLDLAAYRYQYGCYLGLIHEALNNITYRNEVEAENEKFEKLTYSFMPKCFTFFKSVRQWVVMDDVNGVFEAFQINDGYNQIRPLKAYLGYNEQMLNIHDNKRPNRAYYSSKDIPGSFVDNFRSIGFNNYRDLNSLGGEMVAIRLLGNEVPIIVQKNGIIRIVVEERVVQQSDDTQEEFLLAKSREFISEKYEKLSTMGSQHNSSVISSPHAIYGVDWIRRKLWMVMATEGGLVAKDMAIEMGVAEEIKAFFDRFAARYNITRILPDKALLFEGIVTGYDSKNKEVYFSFFIKDFAPDIIDGVVQDEEYFKETYVFAERLMAFKGTVGFHSPFYLNINDDLYSIGYVDSNLTPEVTNKFFLHNDRDNPLKFYGVDHDLVLTFIVNGLQSDKNYANFRKIFEALFIDMPETDLKTIYYETQRQSGTYTFKTKTNDPGNTFWEHSEYLEHQWEVPVIVQASAVDGAQGPDSDFVGKWMKVTITYQPNDDRQKFFIRNIVTKFEISYQ